MILIDNNNNKAEKIHTEKKHVMKKYKTGVFKLSKFDQTDQTFSPNFLLSKNKS